MSDIMKSSNVVFVFKIPFGHQFCLNSPSFAETVVVCRVCGGMTVCVCMCVSVCVLSQRWSSGPFLWPILSQCFPVCLPGEAACFSLRCQFGCQMERGGAVRCLCPPGLHLAADNKTCEGNAALVNTPLAYSCGVALVQIQCFLAW